MVCVYVCTSPESPEQSHVGSSIVQMFSDPFCAPWPGTTDSNRAETETQLQEKNAAEIERLQQELKLQRVRSF